MWRFLAKVAKIPQHFSNWYHFRKALRSRPGANLVFASFSRRGGTARSGSVLCEALWDQPYHWLRVAMFRNALADTFGSGLVGLFQEDTPEAARASLRSLTLTAEEVLPVTVPSLYQQRAESLLLHIETAKQLIDMKLPRDLPAHIFYDGVLKVQRLGLVDCRSVDLSYYLGLVLQYLDFYDEVLGRHDIRAVIVSHPVHFRYGTLVWVALQRGIPVFVINYINETITIRKLSVVEDFHMPVEYPTVSQRDLLSREKRSRLASIGRSYLEQMRQGRVGQIAMVGGYLGEKERYRDRHRMHKILGTDESKPNVVIMAPCWPDFPHMCGRSYYTDFQDWFEMTLTEIEGLKECNWILKPHPAESLYGDKITLKKLVRMRLSAGIFIWPDGVSGNALEQFADCIVTCVGSAGIEYPAIGKTVLTASRTIYTEWGFCHQSHDMDAYLSNLGRIAQLRSPSSEDQENAQIFAALTYTSPPETKGERGEYVYPWGLLSYRLWEGLPSFVATNKGSVDKEIRMMRRWVESDCHSYNVYKGLNAELWSS